MEKYSLDGDAVNKKINSMKRRARVAGQLRLRLGALDVLGLQAFGAFDNFKVNDFPFVQGFEALTLNRGVMHENILAGILGDEAKPFFIIEPLDFTTGHNLLLFSEAKKKTRVGPHQRVSLFSVLKHAFASELPPYLRDLPR